MQFGWTRRQKPTIGTQIDHTQSLASGLVWFAPLWEGGGSSIVDVVGNVNLAVNSAATWAPGNSPMVGAGLNCPVASSGAAATLPSNLKLQAPVTLVGACRYLPTGSAGDYVISLALNNNGQPEYVAFGLRTSAAGVLSVITADSGAVFTGTGGLTLSAGQDVIVVGVFGATAYTLYGFPVNGPPLTPVTQSYGFTAAPVYLSTAQIALGAFVGQATAPHFNIYFGGVYNRALSATEAAAFGMNPWQIFKPRAGVVELVTSPSGYSFSGPTAVVYGTTSSNFTVAPTGSLTDVVTIASSVAGDTLSSSTLTFSGSSAAQTFTITLASGGSRTITLTSSHGYMVSGSPWSLSSTVPLTLTGPAFLYEGIAATLTITPAGVTTDTVTLSDGGKGGTWSPSAIVAWVASGAAKTVTYTAATTGTIAISATSVDGATVTNSPLSLSSCAVAVDAYVTKYGKLLIFGTNSATLTANGNYVPAIVTAANSAPTIEVNGDVIQIGPATWMSSKLDSPFVAYLLQCGSVESIAFTNGGTTSYTAPTITATNGVTVGTPVLASGILAYTITNAGSGYTASFSIAVPGNPSGGAYTQQAWAWVKVVSGSVTSVVPLTGSSLAYGTGYSGTLTGVTLNGGSGTGLTVSCTIGNYIQSAPVTNPGSELTAPPTFTITDGTGAGAAAVAVMSGPLSTDVLTYSASSGWLTTKVNSTSGLLTPPATNAPVTNWVGQLEGPTGRMLGFTATPTMLVGGNVSTDTDYESNICFMAKNKLKAANPWTYGHACTSATLDQNYYPAFWTANSWLTCQVYGSGASGAIPSYTGPTALYSGQWTLQYDDNSYQVGATHPQFVSITNSTTGVTLSPVAGPHTTLPVAGAVTISGGAITAIAITSGGSGLEGAIVTVSGSGSYAAIVATVSGGSVTALTPVCGGTGWSGNPTVTITPVAVSGTAVTIAYDVTVNSFNVGTSVVLSINYVSGSDGACHVSNPWLFAPGNTVTRAKPYALDDKVLTDLTASNGNGPATIRWMAGLGSAADPQVIDPSDIINPNTWSWGYFAFFPGANPQNYVPLGPPNSPTFSGTTTAGSAIITGIASTSSLSAGQPIMGPGIPGLPFSPSTQTTISTVNNSTTITLSAPVSSSGTVPLSLNSGPSGTVVWNYVRFYNTNPSSGTYAWSSPNIYSSENWANSGSDSFGTYLAIGDGPNGANDNGLFLAGGQPSANNGVIELVSNLPHGLKTGQSMTTFYQPQQTFHGNITSTSESVTSITGSPTLFVGQLITGAGIPVGTTISVINSSTAITLSQAATATTSSVALTVAPMIPWSVSGSTPFTWTGIGAIYVPIFVTGPYTIAAAVSVTTGLGGTTLQTINSTSEIPVYIVTDFTGCAMTEPVEYAAAVVANWKNTILHLNIPWACSDATIIAYAQKVAANIGRTNPINIEMGNEHWNSGQDLEPQWESIHGNLTQYFPIGTNLYPHYTPTRTVASYTTTGAALSDWNHAYCLRAANKHYVFCQAFAAAGGNASLVKLLYGGLYSNNGTAYQNAEMVAAVKAYDLPQDYIAVAPYMSGPTDAPVLAAAYPAGYAGNASNGNWPMDALNDFYRHYAVYGQTNVTTWSNLYSQLSGTALQIAGYEGSVQHPVLDMPFEDFINQDSFHHPSYYDLMWCFLLSLQNGNYNVAGSGMVLLNYFSFYLNSVASAIWKASDGVSQTVGRGLSNQFVTPQGGSPGTGNPYGYYQTNQAVALQAIHDWMNYSPSPLPSTTKPIRRWFSGLSRPLARITF